MAIRTKMPPRTRPVNAWAARAWPEMSSTRLRVPLLGAGAVELLVGRDPTDDVEEAPLALHLLRGTDLEDPHVLEGLVVARAPPLLALVVVVFAVLAECSGHRVGVGRLGQLHAARHFHDAAVSVARVRVGRPVELLGERLDVLL